MYFLKQYYTNIIKYEFLNKFYYKNINNIPKLKKIILNFGCKSSDLTKLATALLALEFISGKTGKLTQTKKFNLLLKLKKGNPVGCKIILRKNSMYLFFTKILYEIIPKLKTLNIIKLKTTNVISCNINNTLIFSEFEKNYYLFNTLPTLKITIVTTAQSKNELIFLFNSLKFPVYL